MKPRTPMRDKIWPGRPAGHNKKAGDSFAWDRIVQCAAGSRKVSGGIGNQDFTADVLRNSSAAGEIKNKEHRVNKEYFIPIFDVGLAVEREFL